MTGTLFLCRARGRELLTWQGIQLRVGLKLAYELSTGEIKKKMYFKTRNIAEMSTCFDMYGCLSLLYFLMTSCMHLWHMAHIPRQQQVMGSGHALKRCSFTVAVCELHTGVWGGKMLRALACDSQKIIPPNIVH